MKSNIEDIYIEYSKYDDKIGFYNKQTFVNLNRGFIPMPTKQKEMNLKITRYLKRLCKQIGLNP